jgi:hypothetical protein
MQDNSVITDIARECELPATIPDEQMDKQWLAEKINELLLHDFSRLVSILYRVDVNESKLKALLKQNPGTDAGLLIADLLIERQLEKKRSREKFRSSGQEIDENEKW